MKILKLKSIVFALMAFAIVAITSCNQDSKDLQTPTLENERTTITNYLLNEGYENDRIYFEEDNVFYSACEQHQYKYSIAEMLTTIEETQKETTDAIVSYDEVGLRSQITMRKKDIPSIHKVGNFKYRIDASAPQVWKKAIRDAIQIINTMSNVNGMPRCEVKFTEETRPGYSQDTRFVIKDMGVEHNTGYRILGGAAGPTRGGIIYEEIYLDEDVPFIQADQKLSVVIHEVFHALGFHHTGSDVGLLIGGTGRNDPNSIMQPSIDNNLLPSIHDIKALKKVYPTWLKKPTLHSANRINANKDVAFSYENTAANHPYFWIKMVAYSQSQEPLASKWYKVNDLTSKRENLIMKNVPSNAKYIRVRAYNYKADRYSNWSAFKGI